MADLGRISENPVTGERLRWHLRPSETDGRLARAELWVSPGGGVLVEHLHPHSEERFEVLRGRMVLESGGETRVLLGGERARVRSGTPHRWRNGGDEELHLFLEVDDPRGFDDMIEDAFAAARAGRTDASGRMKLLPGAAFLRAHARNTRPTSPPLVVQRLVVPPLALMARVLGRAGLASAAALALVLVLVLAASAGALTVTEHRIAQGGHRFDVRCGESETATWVLPEGAQNVRVLAPLAGQPVSDGFGERQLATIQDVRQRTDGARTVIEITAVGSGAACEGGDFVWQTGGVEFRARYDLVSHPPVLVSENQAGLNSRQRPARLTASADAGWSGLRWRSWGGETAVARGAFHTLVWVPIGHRDVEQRRVSYPVVVTLSRVRVCAGELPHYTKLSTRFLSKVPTAIRREARPPSTAACLD